MEPTTPRGTTGRLKRLKGHPLIRLTGRLRPVALAAAGAYGATVVARLLTIVVPLMLGFVVDTALGMPVPELGWLPGIGTPLGLAMGALLFLLLSVGRAGLSFVQHYGTARVGHTVATDLRRDVFGHLLSLEVAFHDRSSIGECMTRVTDDTEKIREFMAVAAAELLSITILVVAAPIVYFRLDPVLAVVALAPLPVLLAIAVLRVRRLPPRFLAIQAEADKLTAFLRESLAQVRVVQAFTAEHRTFDAYAEKNASLYSKRLGVARIFSSLHGALVALLGITSAAVLLIGGRRVMAGDLTIGTLLALNSYIFLVGEPVARMQYFLNVASRGAASARRIYDLLDRRPTLVAGHHKLRGAGVRLRWQGVSFAFSDNVQGSEDLILKDVTLDVAPGEHVAVVGASGSGKTALLSLIIRLYDPVRGTITFGGRSLRSASREEIREAIGFVAQDAFLFNTTVYENVAFGRPGATRAMVERACHLADAHEFVCKMPQGYDTVIGERGVTLSGGQLQRLALARTLVSEPRVLVLDDATSAVDARTEERIRASLLADKRGRTLVTVSQRPSTIIAADRVVLLADGLIVERGTHGQLMAAGGRYARLFRSTAAAADIELGAFGDGNQ